MTKTVCTHFYTIKRMLIVHLTQKGFTEPDSTAVTLCGQEVKSLSQQLESANDRKVGSGLRCKGFKFPSPACQFRNTGQILLYPPLNKTP